MKKKLAYLLALFIIFGIVVSGYFIYLKFSVKQGQLRVLSSPGANVVVNNKSVGKTPYEESLQEGEYLVKLIPDAEEASDSATWDGKVRVYQNTLTFVNRELGSSDLASSGVVLSVKKMDEKPTEKGTGEIEVKSDPDGAVVYLNNEEQGIAPLVLSEVEEGEHELAVDSPGFFRRSQKIRVDEGFRVIAEYKLAVDPTYKKVDKDIDLDEEASDSAELDEENKDEDNADEEDTDTSNDTSADTFNVTIAETGTGWLRVRSRPSTAGEELGTVDVGDTVKVLEERTGWYKIDFDGEDGWISSTYVTKEEEEEESTDQ